MSNSTQMIPYLITPSTITFHMDNRVYIVNSTHPNFSLIREAIKYCDWEVLPGLADIPKTVEVASAGQFRVTADGVFHGEEPVHNVVSQRIMDFLKEGLDFTPLLKFLERVNDNPSKRSVDELYKFLEHKHLPIDADGYFYAYKAVTYEWFDKHSRKFANTIGTTLTMKRNMVCDDANIGCSYGFHVGSIEYVRNFVSMYGEENGDRILIVRVNPADVVSVPHDCNCQKIRTCSYTVMSEFIGKLPHTTYDPENPTSWEEDDEDNDDPADIDYDEEVCY